jgi:hypothetical protein
MPDTKITALTAIGANPIIPATFPIPMVDLTDTSMAASGTTKKVTVNQILGSGGTATLASATITGDLTVDTSTLKVDSSNDRVLIGTLTALGSAKLSILGKTQADTAVAADVIGNFNNTSATGYGFRIGGGSATGGYALSVNNNVGSEFHQISGTGIATWSNVGGVAGTAMTLNSTGLLVGTTATGYGAAGRGLVVAGGATSAILGLRVGSLDAGYLIASASRVELGGSGTTPIVISNGGDALTIDTARNVGVGVTPSAGRGAIQLSAGVGFPATQVASSDANTLDDYEEGTFTPIISGASTAGTGTYTTQVGRYTKIGRLVTFQLRVAWTAHTGTGGVLVGGLPFTSSSVSNSQSSVTIGFFDNFALTASNIATAFMQASETSIALYQYPVGGGSVSAVGIDSSADIMISGSYTV